MFNHKKLLFLYGSGAFWGLLGFKRGLESYDYYHKRFGMYSEGKYQMTYLYSAKVANGLFGTLLYVSPIFFIPMLVKEIYRLEINVRNIEDAKKQDYYNELI